MRSVARAVMALALALVFSFVAVAPEIRSFHGRVLYVAGQAAYQFLKSGDAVTVVGVVTPDGNNLIAVSITPDR